jgi:hypothetical protein
MIRPICQGGWSKCSAGSVANEFWWIHHGLHDSPPRKQIGHFIGVAARFSPAKSTIVTFVYKDRGI